MYRVFNAEDYLNNFYHQRSVLAQFIIHLHRILNDIDCSFERYDLVSG